MLFEKLVLLPKERADYINNLLETEPKDETECFGEDEKISFCVKFTDEFEMSIELIGVQFEYHGSNTPYTQAVLYRDNDEVDFTEPCDEILDDWLLTDDSTEVSFMASVKTYSNKTELEEYIKDILKKRSKITVFSKDCIDYIVEKCYNHNSEALTEDDICQYFAYYIDVIFSEIKQKEG